MVKKIFILILAFTFLISSTTPIYAASCIDAFHTDFSGNPPPKSFEYGKNNVISFILKDLEPGTYYITVKSGNTTRINKQNVGVVGDSGQLSVAINDNEAFRPSESRTRFTISFGNDQGESCELWNYQVTGGGSCNINYTFKTTDSRGSIDVLNPMCIQNYNQSSGGNTSEVTIVVSNVIYNGQTYSGPVYIGSSEFQGAVGKLEISNGSGSTTLQHTPDDNTNTDTFIVRAPAPAGGSSDIILCSSQSFTMKDFCPLDELKDRQQLEAGDPPPIFELCNSVSHDDEAFAECDDCIGKEGIWTALGCIKFDPLGFTKDFLSIALGVAGGAALLLMVYGAFLVTTSTGDPKKADEGKQVITGTIAGLLFIVFSLMLLRLIGLDILNIPGF